MKKIVFSYLLICLGLLSCSKNSDADFQIASPFKAMKDNNAWLSTSSWANFSKKDGTFTITGNKHGQIYYDDEQVSLTFKSSSVQSSGDVKDFSSDWKYIVGGDAVADSYTIDPSFDNQLKITKIDAENKTITGTFVVRMVRDARQSSKGETLLFKSGQFNLSYRVVD
ncbi:DUF6252 family protein [Paludibacter sp.]|uniref:DUF6252 family protein n=1 Tax=Paludibacter sp. TaxID=1898105 RepID=UPI001354B97A|nr:DUF6252 family protein [Paludibacter sp.]MTK52752.1 hypothetical protein [Paludibacter sp.]